MSKDVKIPRVLLEHLDMLAGEAQLDSFKDLRKPPTNPKLYALAHDLYMVTHWYLSPDCRKNHPEWNPQESLRVIEYNVSVTNLEEE